MLRIAYEAAPGEANVLSIHKTQGATWIISEIGGDAEVTAGNGCSQLSPQVATCASPAPPGTEPLFDIVVDVGDMNDGVAASSACGAFLVLSNQPCQVTIDGGEGGDDLHGPDIGDCELVGGSGDDVLRAGRARNGSCQLDGGQGSDLILGGERGSDVAVYSDRVNPVRVNLRCCWDAFNDGEAGEQDSVFGVREVRTGSGDDVIVGNSEANDIIAGGGRDTILARGGNDRVFGGPWAPQAGCRADGFDRIYGGAGNDGIRGCGGNDFIRGGPGHDGLTGDRGNDTIRGDLGRDTLKGWLGNDTLYARDGYLDLVVGYSGHDRARLDRGLDRTGSIERLF